MTFSINFEVEGAEETWSADWHSSEDRWILTYLERASTFRKWYDYGPLKNDSYGVMAYRAILDAFGLPADKYNLEDIARMSPIQLSRLGKKDPISDTIGDQIKASEARD